MSANGFSLSSQRRISQLLAFHREGPNMGLEIFIPLNYQMDLEFCDATSSALAKSGGAWEVKKATPDLWRQLPKEGGLYMFVFESALSLSLASETTVPARAILYIGKAGGQDGQGTLRDRYRKEYSNYIGKDPGVLWNGVHPTNRKARLERYLTIFPLQYWFIVLNNLEEVKKLEGNLIKIFNPPLNTAGRAIIKVQPPKPAF